MLAGIRELYFLGIDEVSRHAFYGEAHQHLYDILSWRAAHRLPTIITSNEPLEALYEIVGGALLSRMNAEGGVLEFGGSDYRQGQGRFKWETK